MILNEKEGKGGMGDEHELAWDSLNRAQPTISAFTSKI